MLYFLKLYEISMGRVYCYKAPILWFSIILFIFILHLPYFCIHKIVRISTFACFYIHSFIFTSHTSRFLSIADAAAAAVGAIAKYALNCNVKFYTLLYMYCSMNMLGNIKSDIA